MLPFRYYQLKNDLDFCIQNYRRTARKLIKDSTSAAQSILSWILAAGLLRESYSRQDQLTTDKERGLAEATNHIRDAQIMDLIHESGTIGLIVTTHLSMASVAYLNLRDRLTTQCAYGSLMVMWVDFNHPPAPSLDKEGVK